MKIAIASGKGGTGKTTIAVNLALSLGNTQLLDCDVEEPNCNLFLRHDMEEFEDVTLPTPLVNNEKCNLCGDCAKFCQYNAIAVLPSNTMVFPKLCHGCGGCTIVCPEDAIEEESRVIGSIERSVNRSGIDLWQGILSIGEPMASPVIRQLQDNISGDHDVAIIDSPPGTACPVIASLSGVDYCILVTEPTPFGLHDLKLAVDVVHQLQIPFGVLINRFDVGDNRVEDYCTSENIPVLMKIPHDREIAVLYSKGIPFVRQLPGWDDRFANMLADIREHLFIRAVE